MSEFNLERISLRFDLPNNLKHSIASNGRERSIVWRRRGNFEHICAQAKRFLGLID